MTKVIPEAPSLLFEVADARATLRSICRIAGYGHRICERPGVRNNEAISEPRLACLRRLSRS
jgi:hypothetical protein